MNFELASCGSSLGEQCLFTPTLRLSGLSRECYTAPLSRRGAYRSQKWNWVTR